MLAGEVLEDYIVDKIGLPGVGADGADAGAAGLLADDVGCVEVCRVALDGNAIL